jgi:hypothetical protein
MEVFDQLHLFSKKKCFVYGKLEEVKIMSADLLWKPAGCLIRFVFAKTSKGSIVLMCSDLTINPLTALELYCSRIRIECMLDMFKNVINGFCYRFWSKKMPKESRKTDEKQKNCHLQNLKNISTIKRCWDGCERFRFFSYYISWSTPDNSS